MVVLNLGPAPVAEVIGLLGSLPQEAAVSVIMISRVMGHQGGMAMGVVSRVEARLVIKAGRSTPTYPHRGRCRVSPAPGMPHRKLLFREEVDCANDGRITREIFTNGITNMVQSKSMTGAVNIWESSILIQGNKLNRLIRQEGFNPERSTAS
jgi:hypothetical protein